VTAIQPILIDDFELDASLVETHTFDSEVTEHPVETGSDVADHIRVMPDVVVIEGIVSDSPIGALADRRSITEAKPSDDCLAWLKAIRSERRPVTIVTSLGTYTEMVMQQLEVPRTADTGEALRFRASFKQIIVVTNRRTTTVTAQPRGKRKVNRGSKPAIAVDDYTQVTQRTLGQRAAGGDFAGFRRLVNSPLSNETLGL
jgi:hypothetical protein